MPPFSGEPETRRRKERETHMPRHIIGRLAAAGAIAAISLAPRAPAFAYPALPESALPESAPSESAPSESALTLPAPDAGPPAKPAGMGDMGADMGMDMPGAMSSPSAVSRTL